MRVGKTGCTYTKDAPSAPILSSLENEIGVNCFIDLKSKTLTNGSAKKV